MWEILNCEIPYRDVDSSAIIWGVGSSSLTLPIPSGCPRSLALLMQQCWSAKPRNRPSFRQILMHLEIAAPELTNIDPNYFFSIQQQWRDEIRNCMKRMKRRRSSVVISNEVRARDDHFKEEIDHLIHKRKEELLHAQHVREEYERKRECANNLYMELMTCLLKLEQREKDLIQRENELQTKNGHQKVNLSKSSSIISPFVEKVPQVFQKELYDQNKIIPYSVLNSQQPNCDSDCSLESDTNSDCSRFKFADKTKKVKDFNRKKYRKSPCHCKTPHRRRRRSGRHTTSHISKSVKSVNTEQMSGIDDSPRHTPRPSVLVKDFDKKRETYKTFKLVDTFTQTDECTCYQSDSSPQNDSNNTLHIDKSTATASIDCTPSNLTSPNYCHSRLGPKMSTTSTFDSGYGDGYQSCLSTPSTHSTRVRFPDKSPMTPNSAQSGCEAEFDVDECNANSMKVCRIKCRQSNSNTLPSLSSIDENGTNEDSEKNDTSEQKNATVQLASKQVIPKMSVTNEIDNSNHFFYNEYDNNSYDQDSNSSSLLDFESDESVHSSDDDESKYLLKEKFHKAIHQFNTSSQRYCNSLSSSIEEIDQKADNEDLNTVIVKS